jgi:DNA-binding NtrC family response regulator
MSLTILIVEDEDNARHHISKFLIKKGYTTIEAPTIKEAKTQLNQGNADIVLLDAQLPDGFGPTLIEETRHVLNRPPIIMITAYGDIDMAVTAMKNGAHDFFQKPIELKELEQSIIRAGEVVQMRRELAHLRQNQQFTGNLVVGSSPEIISLYQQAQRAAMASVSVLITGETGTGKEILAKAIHQMGPRADKQFIAINCAAIQLTMLETELFGHEAGSFTGAEKRKLGLMEVADDGILFLDEISSMPLDIQAKLLRALEEQSFRRMGGTEEIKVDVQVLAASNRPLKKMIEDNEFREDLYYRLKVVDLHMPALRDRKEDIPEFVGFMINELNPRMGLNIQDITPKALELLIAHDWPGNIRELRNVIERAMLFCDDPAIDIAHLPPELVDKKPQKTKK